MACALGPSSAGAPEPLASELATQPLAHDPDTDQGLTCAPVLVWSRLHSLVSLEIAGEFASMGIDPDQVFEAQLGHAHRVKTRLSATPTYGRPPGSVRQPARSGLLGYLRSILRQLQRPDHVDWPSVTPKIIGHTHTESAFRVPRLRRTVPSRSSRATGIYGSADNHARLQRPLSA
jgi:hypothetical protein